MGASVKPLSAQKPSICRIVIYTDHGGKEHPAVVTSVPDMENATVNLHVMTDGGPTRWAKDVPHQQETPTGNSWRWPTRS